MLLRLPTLLKQHGPVFENSINLPINFEVCSAHPLPASVESKINNPWFYATDRKVGKALATAPAVLITDWDDLLWQKLAVHFLCSVSAIAFATDRHKAIPWQTAAFGVRV